MSGPGGDRAPGPRRRFRLPASARGWLAFVGAFWPFLLGSMLVSGGLAAIVLGYLGVAGTLHVGLQLPYLVSGGLLGLALVVLGSALIVVQVLGRQVRLTRRLVEGQAKAAALRAPEAVAHTEDGAVVAVKGARRFHRPDCLLVKGKEVQRLDVAAASSRGLEPCRVCDPSEHAAS
jgi:hypothetical protein